MLDTWNDVCALSELIHAQPVERDVGDKRILLVRLQDEVFAYPSMCPHMDEPLINGMCDDETITCLKHLWQWDLRSGAMGDLAEQPLQKFPVKIVKGHVYVSA